MGNYDFPHNVEASPEAINLIRSILNNDPSRRPTINEIMASDWINFGNYVPTYLPASTLACPPSHAFIR